MAVKSGGSNVFVWIFILILVFAGGFIVYYKGVVEPNRELDMLKNQTTILEKNITELQDIIEKNQTVTKETVETKVPWWAGLSVLGLIIACLVIVYLLAIKPQSDEREWEASLDFWQGTPGKSYEDGYWYKVQGEKLGKFVKWFRGYYKAGDKFPVALLVFCRNRFWNNDKRFSQEPPKEQLIGFCFNLRNMKKVYEIFDDGTMALKDMIEATKAVAWGMRGMHYEAYKPKPWEEQVAIAQAGSLAAFEESVEKEAAVRRAVEG